MFNVQGLTFISKLGASVAAIAVVAVALAFVMLRRSRRQNYLYYNKELGEIVPSLSYRKQDVDAETVSVDSFEFDVRVWMFTHLPE